MERTASAYFVTVAGHDWMRLGNPTLAYHDQALKQVGSRAWRFIAWCRGQIYLVLFGLLIFFQVATWLEINGLLQIEWVKRSGFSQVDSDSKGFLVNLPVTSWRHVCAHAKIDQGETPER